MSSVLVTVGERLRTLAGEPGGGLGDVGTADILVTMNTRIDGCINAQVKSKLGRGMRSDAEMKRTERRMNLELKQGRL